MLKNFRLAAVFFWRECRAGEWLIIFLAVLLAVAATSALHFYTDRLLRAFENQSARLLGGSLAVRSPSPINQNWVQLAERLGLKQAQVWAYPSMIASPKGFQLANIQAVSAEYPLFSPPGSKPKAGEAWVEPRLLNQLNLKLANELKVGQKQFKVTKILTGDTDSLNTGWLIAPRVMIPLADVPATGTVIPGSRVEYRLLLDGSPTQLKKFRDNIEPTLLPGQRILDTRDQQFVLTTTLENLENYLQLILLVCLMMSGVAIALSISQYMRRHLPHVALWRCLGASQSQIRQIFFLQLLFIALAAGLIGLLIGYLTQLYLASLLQSFLSFPLPGISFSPVILGFATATFLLFAFAYPIIYVLPKTPAMFIWRGETTLPNLRYGIYLFSIATFLIIFISFFLNFSLLTLFFIDVLLLAVGFLYAFALLLLALLKKLTARCSGPIRRGLSELIQHPQSVGLQFVGFSLILLLLGILFFIQSNLLTRWQTKLAINTPNFFAINISKADLTNFKTLLAKQRVVTDQVYPMVRARLISLNNQAIMQAVPASARSHNALHRELNLSWTLVYPKDNQIVAGKEWDQNDIGKNLVSVEKNIAEQLQIKIGDRLGFQTGAQQFSATVSNLRSLDWGSFSPNFFMIFTPGLLENLPTTYITSFHLNSNQLGLIPAIQNQFPNITVIDIANLLAQVQNIIEKISIAVSYLFLFALAAGGLIFITSIQASLDERRQTYHLMRVLGGSRNFIMKSILVEFTVMLIMVIGVSWIGSKLITSVIIYRFFQ